MELYFIAILPNYEIRKRIIELKLEVKEKYGVKHALKLPAHITVQIPFKFPEEQEPQLLEKLHSFAAGQKPFQVHLNGFGSFPPRVIFIKIENQDPVTECHAELQQIMSILLESDNARKVSSFHPHITIATRDLEKEVYKQVWPKFKNREFKAAFRAESFILFRHDGKTWQICEEFEFSAL
ncbi:2'-5' RNA ligase [Salinimicrobium marinum]|uniref:2'-5' RNA ligase n=1 Tax=Salinimicrobium marinum TaxID=680283 RepID=A0A918VWR3_9FLAO|nr:2'-5' RNA ligase family protein [Salinimicrobium marinum]GHA31954.1 2'-5' RNA ligase [Salinimicrobium marinum]